MAATLNLQALNTLSIKQTKTPGDQIAGRFLWETAPSEDMFAANNGDEHIARPVGEAGILVTEKHGSV